MRRSIRQRRQRLRPAPFLWLFLIVNLGFAAVDSRVTSVTHVEVHGARTDDRPRIDAILSELRGVPARRIHWRALETAVLREPSVRSVEFTRNSFGRGDLWLAYRQPVARFVGRPDFGLDAQGVLFVSPGISRDIPTLKLPNGGVPTLLTQGGNWDAVRIADLAQKIRAFSGSSGVGIEVDERGVVCLNMSAGRVVLGSCDDMEKKLSALKAHLADLSQVQELNLTRPDVPTVVPRKNASQEQVKLTP
ncbi:cell division protein FtsQ/DivIB [Fimbriimonas ginsengisoli]|uniref:Cell division protein FtsQ n=1 Tax=Fimbriimonas ginsengisoli Gsoil 348 TaxID=661478 RepID=A0A068NXJ3_FIMGI|nr:hypothetical protein [Fimbriimonas ginsengisoli]AIE88151.1 hypothetical protein OP10G_4783 [Fimbriimonas ginsengisoli Gsoil 348]